MKGYYLFAPVEAGCVGSDSGVERKVRAQHRALSEYFDTTLVILPVVEYSGSIVEKVIRRLPYTPAWRKWEYRGEFDDADFLYIREPYYDSSFVRYLKKIRKRNPKISMILEIPTYPPDPKTWTLSSFMFILKNLLNSRKTAKQVDTIVNYYSDDKIWGKACIKTINGYDYSQVSLPTRNIDNEINIISVSVTAYWHGYDRVIEGLNIYYKNGGKENIIYHLVGNIVAEHEQMVRDYGLQNHVILHGPMSGENLEALYRKAVLGIDVLGGHRKNYPISSSLKSREYGAWGLPIITSSPVDYLEPNSDYQFIAPYDDSPLDFEKVVDYYHKLFDDIDSNKISQAIRRNAIEHCDMLNTMKPIVEWIKQNR